MKYCPICDKNYPDEMSICKIDRATLFELRSTADAFIGNVIKGRYQVIRKLGEGGMGTVYLADQVSIGRKVALKVLHGEFAKEAEFVKRFRQEARLAASLNHRNVVTVYDFDQADDGSLFIAMEYVDGRTLKAMIQQRSLSMERAVRLGIQIAEGLEAAHRAGVVHRDVKPDNIMVVHGTDEVKLSDFGIARLRDAGTSGGLTRSGVTMGTPAYMAPEQIEGREITDRTDIYAFGIVLYEMSTGTVPFVAQTPGTILSKHLRELPVPPRKVRRGVPSLLEHVIMQALEKQPQKRQRNMGEVVAQLRAAEAGSGVSKSERDAIPKTEINARPKDAKSEKKPGRNLIGLASALAVVFIIAGVGAILWIKPPIGSSEPTEKVAKPAEINPAPEDIFLKIRQYIREAEAYRDRGEYSLAFRELEKAKKIDGSNPDVQKKFDEIKGNCNAEKVLRQELKCS